MNSAALAQPPVVAVPSATGVDARLVLAGPGARSIAFILDWLFRASLALAYLLLASLLINGNWTFEVAEDRETLWYLAGIAPGTAIYLLYHPILETLMSGRTPGKRMIGVRILSVDGQAPGIGALVVRNMFRIIDSMPLFYVVGLLFVMFGRRHLRLGDIAAGTVLTVERAPFLAKLAAARGAPLDETWQQGRQRAASLRRRAGTGVDDALAVVDDYRRAARDLGVARAMGGAGAQAEYLDAVYTDLHDAIHRPARRGARVLWSLFRDRVPAALRHMRVHLLAVTLLFIISAIAGWWLIYSFPDLIAMFADQSLISTVERGELWTEGMLNVVPAPLTSVNILTNNIVVAYFAFCSGLVFGLGTFYIVGLNGLSLGAIFAFVAQHGLAGKLFDFVIAHGCVELSCICISGAAGAYMGEALIRPGAQTRAEAFRRAARESIHVLAAVTLLLFICGFIEGYISPDPEVPRWARVTIGVGYWFFMVSLLRGYVFGRSRGGPVVAA